MKTKDASSIKISFSLVEHIEIDGKDYWQPKVMFNTEKAVWHIFDIHSSIEEARKQLNFIKAPY